MHHRDTRVDAYIENAAPFAQAILKHLRALVHEACPDVQETIKWGFPHFMYQGILCSMASFKQHCAFGFWKAKQLIELSDNPATAMGDFGRIGHIKDLPSKTVLKRLVKQAMQLNEHAAAKPSAKPKAAPKPELPLPEALLKALNRNKKAKMVFEAFSPSHRREYIEWISEAKREETVQKRVATTIEQLLANRSLHWKYKSS